MATYALNPNGLLDTGDELRGITATIRRSTEELDGDVNKFITSNTGAAADAFINARAKWQAGIMEMEAALTVASQRINEIHNTYRLGDARGAALFQGHV
jgi:WXG100 family type VII secretion target